MHNLGQWFINNDEVSHRGLHEEAAFFHFRHWDDFISKSISTIWSKSNSNQHNQHLSSVNINQLDGLDCMVIIKYRNLYL